MKPFRACLPARTNANALRRHVPVQQGPKRVVVASAFEGKEPLDRPPSKSVSKEDACKMLGVGSNASFDQILDAKNKMLASAGSDPTQAADIEAAYDVLFMGAMQKRLGGSVSQQVRFADVPQKPKRSAPPAPKMALPGGFMVKAPSQADIKTQVPVFATLALWAVVQALFESQDMQLSDTAGLQTGLTLLYAGYTFKKNKGFDFGKSVGLSLGLLIVGILVGSAVESWLRVDIVPIGAFSSPGVFVSEFAILAVALGSLFII